MGQTTGQRMLARLQKGVKKDVKIVAGCCVETGVKTCDVAVDFDQFSLYSIGGMIIYDRLSL